MFSAGHALTGSYDFYLVGLSVLIAIFASYAALDLGGRVTSAQGIARSIWLAGGATAMGIGIWSMHYVGMLAFRLPVTIQYDWPVVVASLLAAIFASASALFVVSRAKMGPGALFVGSVFMGGGIAAMHYIGMHAMRLQAVCTFSAGIVATSVFLAVIISALALWLAFHFREETRSGGWQKMGSAIVMGAAIPVMHYTGMAAAGFTASPGMNSNLAHALNVSALGTTGVVVVTFMVLGLSIITSLLDRRFSAHASELASSEKRSKQILETSFDAFAGLDSSGRIVDWNAQAESCFGWAKAEVLGKILSETIIATNHREHYEQCLQELFTANDALSRNTRFEIVAHRKDGREIPSEITMSVMGRGENRHLAAFVRDLTERKRFEYDLREAKQTAEVANEAKSNFLASMSHEIRTPMNGILGMTELVLETDLTGEQRENLGLVQVSAESLLSIINDILDFSKIEAGKVDIERIPFDFRESLGETMQSLSIRARQKELELIYEIEPDVPEAVIGDPGRIRQVLINLVGNAIKFTVKGEVFVHVEQEDQGNSSRLHFKIRDSGVGIAEDKLQGIFEPFSQADGSITRRFGGTGLGLTISNRLAKLMGGDIWVESQLGHGSTFHFTTDLVVQSPAPVAPPAQRQQLCGLRVLVVDDNFTNRQVLVGMLTRWGMEVTAMESGREALRILTGDGAISKAFSLILLDAQMPEMDGFTLAAEIKKADVLGGATIMMLTSTGQMGDAARCRNLGISAYFMKPIRQAELLQGLTAALTVSERKEASLITRHTVRAASRRMRVLLVEDNEVNQKLAQRLLERRGYVVFVAGDGRQALEAMDKEPFDIVLMDVQMPEMDGYEATMAIREREKSSGHRTPVVAMTAHARKADEERCTAAGMDAFVSKPIRTGELFSTIENLTRADGAKSGTEELELTRPD